MATLAQTPPMGWNSYDAFGGLVTEAEVRANADYMAANLRAYGWEYVVIDIAWYVENYVPDMSDFVPPPVLDVHGRPQPSLDRFPSAASGAGFKPLADYVHSLGLKFGIHIMRGISTHAVERNLPVKGTSLTTSEMADKNSTCDWSPYSVGVDIASPGAQAWYDSLFEQYAQWEIDFIKVDDISWPYHKAEIEMVERAIAKTGREIVLSLSPGPADISEADHLKAHANMWRASADFWDKWENLLKSFDYAEQWAQQAGPGHWPDLDMIPFGRIGIRQHPLNSPDRQSRFTKPEHYTLMTLWCLTRSPLMLGGNLPDTDQFTVSLLTNKAVLELLNHSSGATQVLREGHQTVWKATGEDGSFYAAFFNTGEQPVRLENYLLKIGLGTLRGATELWTGEHLSIEDGTLAMSVEPHGARLVHLAP